MFKLRLFWKILFGFWLVFASVFSFNLFLTQINSESSKFRTLPPHLSDQLASIQEKLDYLFQANTRVNRKTRRFLRNAYLLDQSGKDYFGKRTPKMLLALHQQVIEEDKPMTVYKKRFLYFGGNEVVENGNHYRLYVSQKFSFLSRGYLGFFIKEFATNLIISTFLISIPLSFLMAWFFTRPIKKLQQAFTEMSDDLNNKRSLDNLTSRSDEFGDLARDFEKMANHLATIIASKNRLLGDVSHELRTPLARLQLAIGIASQKKRDVLSDELARIKLEADRMNQMISSLLDYSRVDSIVIEPQFEKIDLAELLHSIVQDVEYEATSMSLTINTDIVEPLNLIGDKGLLISCLENLLRNALRYASSQISVEAKVQPANHTYDEGFAHKGSTLSVVSIVISDDGDGVSEPELGKLCDAFYRPQLDRSRKSGGVGLGLSIAKKAVQAHQGELLLRNLKPRGFEVTVSIPTDA